MNVYTTDKIRNVVLLGHGGCGKTSLAEAMAYLAGLTSRMGKIDDGNTLSDFGKEEQKRKFSINTSLIALEWGGVKINLLDTPGYFDFVGEVEEAVAAAAGAIIVVSGKAGIEVGTEKAWEMCEKYNIPRFIFVTDMDVDNASFRQVVEDLTEKYGLVPKDAFDETFQSSNSRSMNYLVNRALKAAAPKLRYDVLETLHGRLHAAPVLHGGSGLTDAQFRRLIELGMRKINIATDIFMAQAGACQSSDVFRNISSSVDAVSSVVKRYIKLFGSEGKA